jgi:hypothetical protein
MRPLALAENCVARTPSYQKSKPMLASEDAVSSRPAPTSWVAPLLRSSSETPVEEVNAYVPDVIASGAHGVFRSAGGFRFAGDVTALGPEPFEVPAFDEAWLEARASRREVRVAAFVFVVFVVRGVTVGVEGLRVAGLDAVVAADAGIAPIAPAITSVLSRATSALLTWRRARDTE